MIALDDGALVRVVLAAGRVPRKVRGRWLQAVAERLEARGPCGYARTSAPSVERVRRTRARQRNGRCVLPVEVDHDRVLLALMASGRLSEGEALDRGKVLAALASVVSEWSARWE